MLEKLSSLVNSLAEMGQVQAVVLFGSHARGEAGRKSDVDLLVVVDEESPELEAKIREKTSDYERVIPVISTPDKLTKEPYFLYDVLRDGVVLFKKPAVPTKLPFALPERATVIYSLDMSRLSQSGRVKLNQTLYGARYRRKLKGGVKVYRYKGLVERLGGKMLGRGALAVPGAAEVEIDATLKLNKVEFSKMRMIFVEEL
ncbi:MAG: nucleotidyltransferase domain-containing protein [Hadesarchaea archaeon]|nr:nucleotidyltransferase domain-containing protein [Hadesarchaea archaeon]